MDVYSGGTINAAGMRRMIHIRRRWHASFRRARPSRLAGLLGAVVIMTFLGFSGIALWHLRTQALAGWRDSAWIIGGGALFTAMLLALLAAMLARQFARHEANEQRLRHNELLLHEAQRIAHVGSWSYDRSSRRLSCSRETYRILGLDPTATPSHLDILKCTYPDDRKLLLRAAFTAFQGERVDIELRVACDRQQIRWVQLRTAPPLIAREGTGTGPLRGTLLDITERKKAEASCAQLATIVKSTEDAIFSLSLGGEILSWNRGAQRIYGYPAHEVIGKKMGDLLPPDQDIDTRRLLELVQRGTSLEQYEAARRTKGGETIYVALTISPIKDDHDRIVAASVIARDITTRRNARVCRMMEHAVTRALLDAESTGQALSQAIRIICRSLGWDYGARWQRNRQEHALYICESWSAPSLDAGGLASKEAELAIAPMAPKQGLLQQVLDSGKTIWRADARHDPDPLRAAQMAQAGLRSVFMFPIISNSGPIGVLEFLSRESQKPDDVLLEALEAIGSQIGQYIERKHAEDARLAADARLQRITANVPDVVFQCKRAADGSFSFPFISERVYDLYGERAADVAANPILLFKPVPDEQRLALLKSMLKSKRTGKPWSFETLIRCRDGARKWIRGQAAVSFGDDGSVYWDGVLSDITLQKRAAIDVITMNVKLEQRVAERTRQLEMMNKELETFSYSVSHDLRAPLRAVEGFSRLLQQKYGHALEEGANDYLQRIQRAALRMNELVDDLLKLARISRSEIKSEAVDLSAMARAILKELADSAPERTVNVSIEDGVVAHGDARLLRIMMENLLGNAWKFTQKETAPNITLGTTRQDGKKIIFINDNGAGFDMGRAHKLFGAFQRLHRARDFEGTGIGLATVQRVVALHGGQVWAKGVAGQGATFYFTL